jgi:hypothetical protein
VDFDKEMVVAIGFGPFRDALVPHEAKECGVKKIMESGDNLLVKYTVVRSDEVRDQAAYPLFVVTLPRSKKRVSFEKHETPGG